MKTALVTGGAKGIGRAICRELSKNGFFVIIHYNNSEKEAFELRAEIKNAIAIRADLSADGGAETLFNEVIKNKLSVEVLVNNAGISNQKLFFDITDQETDMLYNVNLKSMMTVSKLFLSDMVRNKYGRIINISSMWGVTGASCEVVYSAVKAGVIGFTKALAKEVGPSNITVNCIAPGVIMTDMCKDLSAEDIEALKEETPLMRLGTPEDIASAAAFFASDGAGFITGQILGINGGYVI